MLQDFGITTVTITLSLNPFEVREVLQDAAKTRGRAEKVSIPLKSGRCCKDRFNIIGINWRLNPFEVREVLQANKSLKLMYLTRLNPFEVREVLQDGKTNGLEQAILSQSLWSQGGAASCASVVFTLAVSLNPFEVREVLQAMALSMMSRLKCLNPFEVREVLQGCFTKLTY